MLSCRYNGNIEIIIRIKPNMYKYYIIQSKSLLGDIGALVHLLLVGSRVCFYCTGNIIKKFWDLRKKNTYLAVCVIFEKNNEYEKT